MLEHFLHRVNLGTDPHETNDVAGDAAGQSDEHVFGPFGERGLPREAQEPDIRLRGGEPGHRLIFSNSSTRPPTQRVGGRATSQRAGGLGGGGGVCGWSRLAWSGEIRRPVFSENTCTCSESIWSRMVSPRRGGVRP